MAELQLSPDDLDRIEDALEDLELAELIDEGTPAVRNRLADYREILIASREALPLQEVPPGILAGVLAEARAGTDNDVLGVTPTDESQPATESWWSRLRKSFLIPGLAVVGTAALILIIVKPTMSDSPVLAERAPAGNAAPSPDAAKNPAQSNEPVPQVEPEPEAAQPEPSEEDEREQAAEEANADDTLYEVATARRTKPLAKQDAAQPSPVPTTPSANVAGAEDLPAEPPGTTQEKAPASWETIERGDKARIGGDCFTASNAYHRALDDGNDSVRARALAGLGLCALEDGNNAKASAYYKEARALDPDVGGYIETQTPDRAAKPSKGSPRKKSKMKKRSSKSFPDNAMDVMPRED